MRSECAAALGRIRAQESFEALAGAVTVKHPKVRRAVAAALGRFRTQRGGRRDPPARPPDASYLVEAEAARALGKTQRAGAFDVLVDVARPGARGPT